MKNKLNDTTEIVSVINSKLYRNRIPEVTLIENAKDIALQTIDHRTLNKQLYDIEDLNALIASKIKMHLMQSKELSHEQIYQIIKETPVLLDAYYSNCLKETAEMI